MKSLKPQLFYIHGGMTFVSDDDYRNFLATRPISIGKKVRWSDQYLDDQLGESCQIIRPRMPLQDNATYRDWKIHFERHFDQLTDNLILVGMSLGGIFLAQYLAEETFPKKIMAVYLVCPPFDDTVTGEDLANGFLLSEDLSKIQQNCSNLTLFFSEDDDVVPLSHAKKYEDTLPGAKIIIFPSKNGHFQVPKFPEIVKLIKNDLDR